MYSFEAFLLDVCAEIKPEVKTCLLTGNSFRMCSKRKRYQEMVSGNAVEGVSSASVIPLTFGQHICVLLEDEGFALVPNHHVCFL